MTTVSMVKVSDFWALVPCSCKYIWLCCGPWHGILATFHIEASCIYTGYILILSFVSSWLTALNCVLEKLWKKGLSHRNVVYRTLKFARLITFRMEISRLWRLLQSKIYSFLRLFISGCLHSNVPRPVRSAHGKSAPLSITKNSLQYNRHLLNYNIQTIVLIFVKATFSTLLQCFDAP